MSAGTSLKKRYSVPTAVHRQCERKHRAHTRLADDADAAAVGFDDGFADRQSHPRAARAVTLIASAIELVENQRLLEGIDARAMVGDADLQLLLLHCLRHADRSLRPGIFCGVLQQMHQ